MADTFRKGEKVQWSSHSSTAEGTVEDTITTRPAVARSTHQRKYRSTWCAAMPAERRRCTSRRLCVGGTAEMSGRENVAEVGGHPDRERGVQRLSRRNQGHRKPTGHIPGTDRGDQHRHFPRYLTAGIGKATRAGQQLRADDDRCAVGHSHPAQDAR